MHNKKAGTTVDLANRPTGLQYGLREVRCDQVNTGDIEAYNPRCLLRYCHVVGVDLVRAVDRYASGAYVAGKRQLHALTGRRNVFRSETLLLCERDRAVIVRDTRLV